MKTSTIEVHDMLSVLSVDEVEKRIGEVPGVDNATVNFALKNATVRYDEPSLDVADIKSGVRLRGHQEAAPEAAAATPSLLQRLRLWLWLSPTAVPADPEKESR